MAAAHGVLVEDLASMVKPGIFIVDDVALPTPITFLILLGEKAVAAKLASGGLGLASGGPRVGRLSETGSDNDDRVGQSWDEHLHDTSPSIVHQRCRRRHRPSCTLSESRSGEGEPYSQTGSHEMRVSGGRIPKIRPGGLVPADRPKARAYSQNPPRGSA